MKRMPHRIVNRVWRLFHNFGLGKISLDENTVIDQARKETGLSDFGDDSFLDPMRRILYDLKHESKTNPMGDFFARQNIVRLLKNRLRAEDLFKRYPEILDRELQPPVVVVGLARSGTTRTHRLLACDPQFVHLRTWEAILPAPYPESFTEETDPRYTEIDYALKVVDYLMPQMRAVHPLGADEPEEESALMMHGFETSLFAAMNPLPGYFQWYIDRSIDASYDYTVKLLKLISWFRNDDPGKPWILKTPEHMVNFSSLLRCFPDAKIVSTHREPLSVLSSVMSMAWMAMVRDHDELDPDMIADQWQRFMDASINNFMAIRDSGKLKDHQIIDLHFEDINRDWQREMEKVYGHFNIPLSDRALESMRDWMENNYQGKHGRHTHSLEQFGLDPDQVRERYRHYGERFVRSRKYAAIEG